MADKYHSRSVHGVYLFELSALAVLSTGVQLLAGAKILAAVTGLPFWVLTVVLAIIAYSYSQYSGIKASVLTDALQMVLMLGCCLLFVPWALSGDTGVSDLVHGFAGASGEYTHLFDRKGLEVFFAFGLPTAIGLFAAPFGDQCFRGHFPSGRIRSGRRSNWAQLSLRLSRCPWASLVSLLLGQDMWRRTLGL